LEDLDHYWDSNAFTEREKAILKFADWFAFRSQGRVDEETLALLKKNFTAPEIIELGCYFAIVMGFQKFNSVFQVECSCPLPPPRAV
jgi:alkylhydroperoxidase family enzyme